MRFGVIGSGIPLFSKEPMTMVHEIYTYDDDDDDDQVVYMRKWQPAHFCFTAKRESDTLISIASRASPVSL